MVLIAAELPLQTDVADQQQQHTVNRVKVTSEGSGPGLGASHISQPPSLFLSFLLFLSGAHYRRSHAALLRRTCDEPWEIRPPGGEVERLKGNGE